MWRFYRILFYFSADCKKRLEPGSLCDHAGQVYCKNCYGRSHGAKGYGYGVGSGILQSF